MSLSRDDLTELASLCLRQAASANNAAVAAELRRLASEYQARTKALTDDPRMPDIAAAFKSSAKGDQPSLQQQQPQPDGSSGVEDEGSD
jgi:hypothetical protein